VTAVDRDLLEHYLVRTRWFAGKSRPFQVSDVRVIADLPGGALAPDVTLHLVTVDYSDEEGGRELYQVPLAGYDDVEERIGHAYVGAVEHDGRIRHLYDAVHDRDAMSLWLDGFIAAERDGTADVGGLRFHRVPGEPLDPDLRASAMTGEQSNSSARFDDTAIMKLFRKVSPGVNPDVEIHEELTRGGSENIAALYGWVDVEVDGSLLQLAMIQEFLRTATDGFELATGSVRAVLADPQESVADSGGDFAGEASRLGAAVAEVHGMLRERFPSERSGADTTTELARAMTERLDRALLTVPELEPYADGLRAVYRSVAELDGLDVQRVHGDLHLGQTLRTSHGWRIVDFEGEPGRPLAERALPDSPWRDVAGMLRSFDYATGVVEMSVSNPGVPDDDAALRLSRADEWSERARTHFVDAYVAALDPSGPAADDSAGSGGDGLAGPLRVLLDAYVADKAVYEVVYEKRNRPAWIGIPLAALARFAD
jgi:maltokinase